MEELSGEEKKALRGSKFAPLPPPYSSSTFQRHKPPRLAHPGGPMKTNKAAALAKFLERKLKDPDGLASINPDLLELAVKNAKDTVFSSGTSKSGRVVLHVDSFGDPEPEDFSEEKMNNSSTKKQKKKNKNKKKKNKKPKVVDDSEDTKLKRTKKKLKL